MSPVPPSPAPRLDYASLALLRPGHSSNQLQAALGSSWYLPPPGSDGWWRPPRQLDGFMARIGDDGCLASVWFFGNFSMRCSVEGLYMNLPIESALWRQPALHRLATASSHRREIYYMQCDAGYRLIVQFSQSRIRRLYFDAPGEPSRGLPAHLRHL